MSESFRHLYKKFVNRDIPQFVRQSYRLVPDFNVSKNELRKANFERWCTFGFDQLVADDLGAIVYEDDDYAIISQVKNATDTDYDIMFICLPKNTQEIQHLPCFLPKNVTDAFYQALNLGVEAIRTTATTNGEEIKRIYVHHHVGPFELNNFDFNISFPHLHMHVMAVCERDLEESQEHLTRSELLASGNQHTYADPSVLVAKDIYEHQYQQLATLDYSTSSLVLGSRPLDCQITSAEQDFLPDFYYEWHKWWAMLAMCFSYLELDENERLDLEFDPEQRLDMVRLFSDQFPIFSQNSLTILEFFANNAQAFDPSQPEKSTYAGIAGAVGWVHDFDRGITELRFGPRILTSAKKMGASDGYYVGFKDKSKYYPRAEERLAIQRQIFSQLKRTVEKMSIRSPLISWQEIESLDRFLADCESKEYYPGIYFTAKEVVKTKNRFQPEATVEQYERLRESEIPLGAPPKFVRDNTGSWAETNERITGPDGAEYLVTASDEESLVFFDQVILGAINRVLDQPSAPNLEWSIDAIPHNFVKNPISKTFEYIDYEPSHTLPNHLHFLIPEKLVNYALVKFGREKPHLIRSALELVFARFDQTVADYLKSLPYVKYLGGGEVSLSELLAQTTSKDDLLGLLVAWISSLQNSQLEKIGEWLFVTKVTSKSIQTNEDLIQVLAYGVGKNDPEKLRQILIDLWTTHRL